MNDKALKVLAPLRRHIAILGLGRTKITDKAVLEINKLPKLVRLEVFRTGITDKGVLELAKNGPPELRRLNLYGTGVTDAGVTALASLRRLERLYLWDTRASAAGVRMLSVSLPKCRIVATRELPKPEAAGAPGNRRRRR